MSKRIEDLKGSLKMLEKDFNITESDTNDFLEFHELIARLEERKLAEKDFKELIEGKGSWAFGINEEPFRFRDTGLFNELKKELKK